MKEIQHLLGQENAMAVRLRAFVLLCRRGKWEQLPVLLGLLPEASGVFERNVVSRLWTWMGRYNQTQIQPTRTQIEQAKAALERAGDRLESRLALEFRTLLGAVVACGS